MFDLRCRDVFGKGIEKYRSLGLDALQQVEVFCEIG
jgi:hypothetical protein